MTTSLRPFLSALVALAMFHSDAQAGNTWTGGGASSNWNDSGNWGGSAPTYGTLTFDSGGTQGTVSSNNSITSMNRLNWTGSLAWTVNGNGSTTLSLFDNNGTQAKIENQSSGLVTINAPVTFAANNTSPANPFGEINAVNGDLTFSSAALNVSGSSVNGIKLFGSGHVTTFNNTVNATGKWIGMTSLNGSTLAIGGTVTSGDVYVMNGGTLVLNSGSSLTTSAIRLGGDFGTTGNQNQTKSGTLRLAALSGGQTFSGTINAVAANTSSSLLVDVQNTSGVTTLGGSIFLDSPLAIQSAAGGTLQITGAAVDVKSQRLTFVSDGAVTVTNAIVSSTSAGSVTKTLSGTLTLNAAGTYRGGTTVSGGTVILGVANALPTASGALAIGGTGATVDLNGRDQTVTGFNDNGGLTTGLLTNTSTTTATFTLNNTGVDNFAGVISDGGPGQILRVVKNGGGLLTLTGSNTYTGETVINAGTLAIGAGGALTSNVMTLNSGGTLDLNPGGSGAVGTLTLNTLAFSGTALNLQGGTIVFDLANGGTDRLVVANGNAAVSGTNYVSIRSLAGLASLSTGTYTLISVPGGGLEGAYYFNSGSPLNVITPSITLNVGGNAYRLSLNSTATELQLVIAAAPPKATVTLMPLGASITEGASADNPYNGGGYRPRLYQYLANDGRFTVNMVGSNTRLFDYNATAANILTTAGQLHNEGHFGSTTTQIRNNLNGFDNSNSSGSNNGGFWLAPGNGVSLNYVTLNVGGNDYVSNPNDPGVVDRLNQIITTVSALRPGVTVIVSNLAWRQTVGPSINSRYNPYIPGMVYDHVLNGRHVRFVDMYSVMSPNDSTANLSSDLIHPNQTGYNLMADAWWKSFAFGAAYWTGNQGASWNTLTQDGSTNWAIDHPRTTDRQATLDAGTDVYFNANSVPLNTTVDANVSIRGLNFSAGASAPVTISGNRTIGLGSGGMTVQTGTGAHTINAGIALNSAQTWSNISSNPLTVSGPLSGSQSLKLVGPSFFNLNGTNLSTGDIAIDSGGVWIGPTGTLSSQGFLYLGNGASSNAGVNASLLCANTDTAVPNAIVTNKADTGSAIGSGTRTIGGTNTSGTTTFSGGVYINGGTVLTSAAGGVTAFANVIANGSDTGNVSRSITIAGDGIILLGAASTYTGSTNVNSGTLQLGATGSLPTSGFLYIGNGGIPFANTSAAFLSANTTTAVTNAIVTNKADTGSATGVGLRTIGGANTSGTVTYNGSIYINGGTVLTSAPGGTVVFLNSIVNGSDTGNISRNVTISGGGTIRLAGSNSYTGATTVSSGTLRLDGSVASSVTVNANAALIGTGTIQQSLTIASGGTMQLNGGTFTVNGGVTNNGLILLSNGARIVGNSPSFVNNGTLDVINAGTFTPPPGFQNNGIILDASVVKVREFSKSGNVISVTIDSHTGHQYQLQTTSSLAVAFANVGTAVTGATGTPLTLTATNLGDVAGFYRVVVTP